MGTYPGRHTLMRTISRCFPAALSCLVLLASARPAGALIIVNTTADNSDGADAVTTLREAIEWVNAGESDTTPKITGITGPIQLNVGSCTITSSLPALSKNTELTLTQNFQLGSTSTGNTGLTGTWTNVNQAGAFQLRFSGVGTPVSSTYTLGFTAKNILVTGGGAGGVAVTGSSSGAVILDQIVINGSSRTGDGILVGSSSSLTISNVEVTGYSSGDSIGVKGTCTNGTITWTGDNYIGLNFTAPNSFSAGTGNRIGNNGVMLSETGTGTIQVHADGSGRTVVANCGGSGMVLDPDATGTATVTVRKVYVCANPNTTTAGFGDSVTGDGIRVEGGIADTTIGNAADGMGGVTVANASGGAGIQLGTDNSNRLRGELLVQYVRGGTTVNGNSVVNNSTTGARVQNYGFQAFAQPNQTTDTLTVDNCQWTGNTVAGCDFNGNPNVVFTTNLVGTNAAGTDLINDGFNSIYTGNGVRSGGGGVRPSTATGDGMTFTIPDGRIITFTGNTVTGSAVNGILINSLGSGIIGDAGAARNHIGTGSNGNQCGHVDDASGVNAPVGMTTSEVNVPIVRGNGTTRTSGAPLGSGIVHNGSGPLAIVNTTVANSALYGIDINQTGVSPGSVDIAIFDCTIGVNDAGTGPNNQSLGNGSIIRGTADNDGWATVNDTLSQGAGIRINSDSNAIIGDGATDDITFNAALSQIDQVVLSGNALSGGGNTISGNLFYGLQFTSNVGVAGLAPLATGNTSIAVSGNTIGLSSDGATANSGSGRASQGFGNGYSRTVTGQELYPLYFGAGIRFDPNATGHHILGGDDAAEGNTISNNQMAGIYLHHAGVCSIIGNRIGPSTAGNDVSGRQYYGVMLEQFNSGGEFMFHASITRGSTVGTNMPTQYIGSLPAGPMTNQNIDTMTGGPITGYYSNWISDNDTAGIAVEDDGNHVIANNYIGTNLAGTAAVPNGFGGLPANLYLLFAPLSFTTAGVEVGMYYEQARGTTSIGAYAGGDIAGTAGNVISGNTGYGIAQWRDGVVKTTFGFIGTNATVTAAVKNTKAGVYLKGSGVNEFWRSVISGNGADGVLIDGSGDNTFTFCLIGLDINGAAAVANEGNGIHVSASALGGNVIGDDGNDQGGGAKRCYISGNKSNGVLIEGHGNNVLQGNYIGLQFDGLAALGNGNGGAAGDLNGIKITGGGNNKIGGTVTGEGNVIGSNPENGILITASSTVGSGKGHNEIVNNLIGLDKNGDVARANGANGISLTDIDGATATYRQPEGRNTITGNTVSGNTAHGIYLDAAGRNTLTANQIGTKSDGTAARGNGGDGLNVAATTSVEQYLGLANASSDRFDQGNLIAGNTGDGMDLAGTAGTPAHLIRGNWIGSGIQSGRTLAEWRAGTNTSAATTFLALPNAQHGVLGQMTVGSLTIGGALTGEGNTVSGNTRSGIRINGTVAHTVRANRVGLAPSGDVTLANNEAGIYVEAGAAGVTNTFTDNVVSGNVGAGIVIKEGNNVLKLNRIGTDAAGNTAKANTAPGTPTTELQGDGLVLYDNVTPARTQTIGAATEGNLISGNAGNGIRILGNGTYTLVSNVVGENLTGTADVGNTASGLNITPASTGAVTVGGTGDNETNTFGGNGMFGILHEGQQAPVIQANRIGTNANGTAAIANDLGGVFFNSSTAVSGGVTLGGSAANAGNLISGNLKVGVRIGASCAHPVSLLGNKIGTGAQGLIPIANQGPGVLIQSAQANTIGSTAAGNLISGNSTSGTDLGHGVYVTGTGANTIENNRIGSSNTGGSLIGTKGNAGDGVRIEGAANQSYVHLNTVRDNQGKGVAVIAAQQVRVSANTFIDNSGTALDLSPDGATLDGVTLNTATKTGAAANAGLNFPDLERLVGNSTSATLYGSVPQTVNRVEIYRASDPNPSDTSYDPLEHHGGASELLTTLDITTQAVSGKKAFSATLSGLASTDLVTVLAFDDVDDKPGTVGDVNTSEFSRNLGFLSAAGSTVTATAVVTGGGATPRADGTDYWKLDIVLRDGVATPLIGINDVAINYSVLLTSLTQTPANNLTTDANGAATANVTARQAGTTKASVTAAGSALSTQPDLQFRNPALDVSKSSFVASKLSAKPNGTDAVTFTFTIKDRDGLPIPGFDAAAEQLLVQAKNTDDSAATNVTITQPSGVTDANGQITASAVSTATQVINFRGFSFAEQIGAVQQVTFTNDAVDPVNSSIATDPVPAVLEANGTASATIIVTVQNSDAVPISGIPAADITITAEPAGLAPTITPTSTQTDVNGQFRATITGTNVGTATIRAFVRGTEIIQVPAPTVRFTSGSPAAVNSSLAVNPTTAVANNVDELTATIVVADASNRKLEGEAIELRVLNADNTTATGVTVTQPAATDAGGSTTGKIKATVAGTYKVEAALRGGVVLGPIEVTFTPNPPDPAKSAIGVAPAAIVADGTTTATLTITLLDAANKPLSGVLPTELQAVTVPASPQVTVAAPTEPTDADGTTTTTIKGTLPGSYKVQVTARGVLITQQADLTLQAFVDLTYEIGSHFIGLPVQPNDPAPEAVFAALLPTLRLARYRPGTQDYVKWVAGTVSPDLQVAAGKGFWLQLNRNLNLRVVGTPTPDGTFSVNLGSGWNQIGNPFDGPLPFRTAQIVVKQNGVVVGALNSAAGKALVEPYAWTWDPVLGYLLVLDPDLAGSADIVSTIARGRGMWMLARAAGVSLEFSGPQRSVQGRATRSRRATPAEWMLTLEANAGGSVGRANLFGVSREQMAAVLPPESPEAPTVRVSFRDGTGRAVATDLRSGPITRRAQWTALVEAPAETDVTLAWPGANRGLPANHRLWLIDPTNGRRVLMNTRASYQYRNTTGSRELTVDLDPHGQRSLAVTTLTVRPSGRGSGVPVDYTVSVPARVQVTIRGLRGSVVRAIEAQAEPGQNTVVWDRLDSQGRRVPAGVYQVELTATTDEGEIVRLNRTAVVD